MKSRSAGERAGAVVLTAFLALAVAFVGVLLCIGALEVWGAS